jgi:DNA-binding SARP family transcriptional activator
MNLSQRQNRAARAAAPDGARGSDRCRSCTGLDAELVPELEALIRDQPFRERLIGQLMQALYRAARQAEALAVLQAARLRFAEELGLEPTAQLRDLERQILEQDPTLAAPVASRNLLSLVAASSESRPRSRQ